MSVTDWIRQFRALHAEAMKGTLTPEEKQAYLGACDEFARALMGAKKQAARPGEAPRHALRVAKAVQVELESAVTQAKTMTTELVKPTSTATKPATTAGRDRSARNRSTRGVSPVPYPSSPAPRGR